MPTRVIEFKNPGKPLTEDDLREVEAKIGYALPRELRAEYLKHNGGTPSFHYVRAADGRECEVNRFSPIKYRAFDGDLTLEGTVERLVRGKKLIPENLVPFATGSGGDYYCLDREDGSIVFYAMDDCADPAVAASKVARSLRAFIASLTTEEEAFG